MINPRLVLADGSAEGEEGCLSLPGRILQGQAVRPRSKWRPWT